MPPEISVLLPVRDAEPYLPQALQSLSEQTLGDWRCFALDDGSKDGSRALLRRHARRDRRFRVWTSDRPVGVAGALQYLLRRAASPWVARMDADDVCRPDRFERQRAAARDDPHVALWGCRVASLGEAKPGWREYLEWSNGILDAEELRDQAFTEMPLPHPTWFGRRQTLLDAGGYRSGPFLEDYDLFLRLLRRGERFGKLPEVLLMWRDHPRRQTRVDPRAERDAVLRLKARHLALGLLRGELPHLPRRPLGIWGAGKTGRVLQRELSAHGLQVECFVDPLKAGGRCVGLPIVPPPLGSRWAHLLLVAVGPRHLRRLLQERFSAEGRRFGRDYLWCA